MPQLVQTSLVVLGLLLFAACTESPKSHKQHSHSSKMNQHKAHSLINIEIDSLPGSASDPERVSLSALITSRPNVNGTIFYQWILPNEAQVISGSKEGSLQGPISESGESLDIELYLPQGSKAPVLSVSSELNGARIGNARSWSRASESKQDKGLKTHSLKPHHSGKKIIF